VSISTSSDLSCASVIIVDTSRSFSFQRASSFEKIVRGRHAPLCRFTGAADKIDRLVFVVDEIGVGIGLHPKPEGIEPIIVDEAAEIVTADAGIEMPAILYEEVVPGRHRVEIENLVGTVVAAVIFGLGDQDRMMLDIFLAAVEAQERADRYRLGLCRRAN